VLLKSCDHRLPPVLMVSQVLHERQCHLGGISLELGRVFSTRMVARPGKLRRKDVILFDCTVLKLCTTTPE
jgi:hypothetical protein